MFELRKKIAEILLLVNVIGVCFCVGKNDISKSSLSNKLLKEIYMAHVFEDSIKDVAWLKNKSFSPHMAAANYSFLYILFRILDDFNPTLTIEFGIGQSSRLTSQYAAYKNNKSRLFLVEHDLKWINIFKRFIPDVENIKILNIAVEKRVFKKFKTTGYKDLKNVLGDYKFDFIIVDGPNGTQHYSRISVLDLLDNNLAENFVILIDNCDRPGEFETAEEIKKALAHKKIKYGSADYNGLKSQVVIYSAGLSFLGGL